MRQFSVGEVVTWIPDLFLRTETRGDYRIVATMPDRDGQHMYRIKSPFEEYERADHATLRKRQHASDLEAAEIAAPRFDDQLDRGIRAHEASLDL